MKTKAEFGLSKEDSQVNVSRSRTGPSEINDGQSRLSALKGFLRKVVEKRPVGQHFEPEQKSPDEHKPVEISSPEPIKKETVKEICNVMVKVPTRGEAYGHDIPWRISRRMPTEGVFDEETGLYVQASYVRPQNSSTLPRLRNTPGLKLSLSTPRMQDVETTNASLDKISGALRIIYGESSEIESELTRLKYTFRDSQNKTIDLTDKADRVLFELSFDEVGPNEGKVLNEFSSVKGEVVGIINHFIPPKRQVQEAGGVFIKGIVERCAQKQIEDFQENRRQTQESINKVRDEVVPNDKSLVNKYAYHATGRIDIPDIYRGGLDISGQDSKEPGTIFFNSWDGATEYLPRGAEGVLYRFRIKDFPQIVQSWNYNEEEGYRGLSGVSKIPIGREHLDFSLDGGETWMPVVPKAEKLQQAS